MTVSWSRRFYTLLKEVPGYDIDTEVEIKVYNGKIYRKSIYADLILTEIAPNKAKQNRVQKQGVKFLDLKVGGSTKSWEVLEEKAKKVRMMPIEDLRQLKCGNLEKYDEDKSVQDNLNNGREQVLNYVRNLDDKNDYHISVFVVMSVG
ncbi:23500_t:CDS:2, partial [Gigaspora margarita]